MVVEEQDCLGFSLGQESFSQKFEVVHGLFIVTEFQKGGNCSFIFFLLNVDANVNLILNDVLDEVSNFLLSFFHDFGVLLLDISSEKVRNVDTAFQTFFRNVRRDFYFFLFKILLELLELVFAEFLFSDETEDSLWFKFSEGSCSLIVGIQFADTNFSCSIEHSSLVVFS